MRLSEQFERIAKICERRLKEIDLEHIFNRALISVLNNFDLFKPKDIIIECKTGRKYNKMKFTIEWKERKL